MGRVRMGVVPKTLLLAYVLCVALLPLGHHDIACHLKSSTHCTTCTASLSGEAAPHAVAPASSRLDDAGRATSLETAFQHSAPLSASSGRAPPALG